jgi:predicted lipoprotein with Yx(FWY)xxD motif
MKRFHVGAAGALVALLAVVVVAIAGTHASAAVKPATAAKTAPTVSLRKTKLGKILVDSKGRTLYLFEKDKTTKSTCSGACAAAWPLYKIKGKPHAGAGVKQSLLHTNAAHQVTYNGHPLYRYAGDSRAGQTNGQGLKQFGAEWYVLNAAGKKIDES